MGKSPIFRQQILIVIGFSVNSGGRGPGTGGTFEGFAVLAQGAGKQVAWSEDF
jgi:hypothetical protein